MSWVVVELDRGNHDGVSTFVGVLGPFTEAEAKARAEALNARNEWCISHRAQRLSTKHWSEA